MTGYESFWDGFPTIAFGRHAKSQDAFTCFHARRGIRRSAGGSSGLDLAEQVRRGLRHLSGVGAPGAGRCPPTDRLGYSVALGGIARSCLEPCSIRLGSGSHQRGSSHCPGTSLRRRRRQNADTYALLAEINAQRGRCRDARIYANQAISQDPNSPLALSATEACQDHIAYSGCHYEGVSAQCGLILMSAEPGSQAPRPLTRYAEDVGPAAHGSRIAFMSKRDGNWDIYLIHSDGSGLKRLTHSASQDGLPTWSPDGQTITRLRRAVPCAVRHRTGRHSGEA